MLGFGLFLAGVLGLLTDVGHDRSSQPLGRELLGVPCGLLGWGISAVGMVLLVAGFALHTVAAGRRRQVERELPWPLVAALTAVTFRAWRCATTSSPRSLWTTPKGT